MITTGGSEALLFALNSCLDSGDEVIIPEPFYANYNGFSASAGIKVKPISTSINNGFALPPIEEFEKLITNKTKAIVLAQIINNPVEFNPNIVEGISTEFDEYLPIISPDQELAFFTRRLEKKSKQDITSMIVEE